MAMAHIDLEAEYNNRARVPDHPAHIAGWHRDAAAYRASARCELDLPYGPGERNRIDVFYPPHDESKGPVVLFIHGGYWQALDKSSASHLARGANERGLIVAVPSYDLAPKTSLGEIIEAIRSAADFITQRLNAPLIVCGHSAGGHLAACLMARPPTQQRPIRAAMPISGLFDLAPLVPTSINGALSLTDQEARRLSPILWAPPEQGHITAVVGGAESSEFKRQSREIVKRWSGPGMTAQYHEVSEAHHFDVIAGLANPADPLVNILMDLAVKA
jgi:acetyl esterase/lipase